MFCSKQPRFKQSRSESSRAILSQPGNASSPHCLFVYGTLQLPERVHAIIGRALTGIPAQLEEYRCGCVTRADFPGIVPDKMECTRGQLLKNLSHADLLHLDAYEGELYRRVRVNVLCDSASCQKTSAWVYVIAPWAQTRVTRLPWSVEWYRQQRKRLTYRS